MRIYDKLVKAIFLCGEENKSQEIYKDISIEELINILATVPVSVGEGNQLVLKILFNINNRLKKLEEQCKIDAH